MRSVTKFVALATVLSTIGVGAPGARAVRRAGDLESRPATPGEVRPTPDALTTAFERGRLDRAEYALERASSLFDLAAARARFGDVERADPHDATLLLRDLVLHKDELSGSDKRRAGRILSRPSDGARDPHGDGYASNARREATCRDIDGRRGKDACLHWVTNTQDASTRGYVDDAVRALKTVWQVEIKRLGYRRPRPDTNSRTDGGNRLLDIYFVDIGDDGLYGYCTTDEPGAATKKRVSGYCVLDNDYTPNQYDAPPPEVSGLAALRITMAHEFFHAVQFNYDWREAKFLMEGTAVWIEDEVFDAVNASYAYLFDSALHQPEVPLDAFKQGDDGENFEYGAFIFFTWLSEVYGQGDASKPETVRQVWNKAGRRKSGIEAVQAAINNRGFNGPSTPFRDFFASWGVASSLYDLFYSEGFDGDCPSGLGSYADVLRCWRPPSDGQFVLGGATPSTGARILPVDRRSNRIVEIYPASGNTLRLLVNLPKRRRGGEATLIRLTNDGRKVFRVALDRLGDGSKEIAIGGSTFQVNLILSNTGAHDDENYRFQAEVQ